MSHDARKRGPTISTVTAETLANRLVNDEFRNAPPGALAHRGAGRTTRYRRWVTPSDAVTQAKTRRYSSARRALASLTAPVR